MKECNLISDSKKMLSALPLELPSEVYRDVSDKINNQIDEIEKLRAIIIENRKAILDSGSVSSDELGSWI